MSDTGNTNGQFIACGPNSQSRVFEVTKDGQVVWELKLPFDFGVYRSERVSPPPLVRAL